MSYGQDERAFRDLLVNENKKGFTKEVDENYRIQVRSDRYHLDIDGDERAESFFTSKRDGQDWLTMFDTKGEEIFRYRFRASGPYSRLFKLQMRRISKKTKVIILYFFEGVTKYLRFNATARVYFLTIDNNDLKTLSMYKGPYTWNEQKGFKGNYSQRTYEISLFDFDKDLEREIAVRYGLITRVFKYLGEGKWYRYERANSI